MGVASNSLGRGPSRLVLHTELMYVIRYTPTFRKRHWSRAEVRTLVTRMRERCVSGSFPPPLALKSLGTKLVRYLPGYEIPVAVNWAIVTLTPCTVEYGRLGFKRSAGM